MASYLTSAEATGRLYAFEIESYPSDAALALASRRLDTMGPFLGSKYTSPQTLAFPRTYVLDGDVEGVVPDAVLDWCALEAHKISVTATDGDGPPVTSVSLPAGGSVTYARPLLDTPTAFQRGMLTPYLRTTGTIG